MSPKRPSKQKRAAQNRAERAARAARTTNAAAEPARPVAPRTTSAGGGSLLSRLRSGGSTSGAASSASRGTGAARERAAARVPDQPPGYRAALSAVLAAAAGLMLCTVALRYPVNASGDVYTSESLAAEWSVSALRAAADQPDATAPEVARSIKEWTPGRSKATVAKALWPLSLALVLPLIGAGLGFQAVRKRSSAKVVNRALYATLFGAILTQGLLLLFLPAVLAMGVAMFQTRKAETIAAASSAPPAGDGVIDVEAVDVDEVEAT